MRLFVCLTSLLIAVSTIDAAEEVKPPVPFEQGLKEAKTVLDCAKLLQAEIHAVATQTLTVHDKASLDKAKTEIVLGGVRAGEIAAKLKTLPVPSAAERAKLTAEIEAADAAHRKANEEKLKAHLASLPEAYSDSLKDTTNAFYAKLGGYGEIFTKYFRPDPEK